MAGAVDLATFGALVGEPARARMLTALMSGSALTATELAAEAGITPPTASAHLARLTSASLICVERQGRHRYYRLRDASVAEMLEQAAGFTPAGAPLRTHGPADPAMRRARVCYDHLAGERGVWMFEQLRNRSLLHGRDGTEVSAEGEAFLARLGLDLARVSATRRTFARRCVDWSERRHHLGGALGAALLERLFALRWARREGDSRIVIFSRAGEEAFAWAFRDARS